MTMTVQTLPTTIGSFALKPGEPPYFQVDLSSGPPPQWTDVNNETAYEPTAEAGAVFFESGNNTSDDSTLQFSASLSARESLQLFAYNQWTFVITSTSGSAPSSITVSLDNPSTKEDPSPKTEVLVVQVDEDGVITTEGDASRCGSVGIDASADTSIVITGGIPVAQQAKFGFQASATLDVQFAQQLVSGQGADPVFRVRTRPPVFSGG